MCHYLRRPPARMPYDEYWAAGDPIASGVIEGACRQGVKDRRERAGMALDPARCSSLAPPTRYSAQGGRGRRSCTTASRRRRLGFIRLLSGLSKAHGPSPWRPDYMGADDWLRPEDTSHAFR
jgi:hypothetical protein